jgi:hypothetical protein
VTITYDGWNGAFYASGGYQPIEVKMDYAVKKMYQLYFNCPIVRNYIRLREWVKELSYEVPKA